MFYNEYMASTSIQPAIPLTSSVTRSFTQSESLHLLNAPDWDDLAVLRAGIRFNQRVGRPPRRLDLREPTKSAWEKQLGMALPTADQASYRFGSWGNYLKRMGYGPHASGNVDNALIEAAGLAHVEEVYPETEFVDAEQSVWDALIQFHPDKGAEKVEVKASALSRRRDNPSHIYWSFKTHNRQFSKLIDRLILVGVGHHPDGGYLVPLARLELPKSALRQVDSKSTVMMYATSVFGTAHSVYKPFVRWRRPGVLPQNVSQYLKPSADK